MLFVSKHFQTKSFYVNYSHKTSQKITANTILELKPKLKSLLGSKACLKKTDLLSFDSKVNNMLSGRPSVGYSMSVVP